MRIAIVTTSRADWSGLGMLAKALLAKGGEVTVLVAALAANEAVQAEWASPHPHYPTVHYVHAHKGFGSSVYDLVKSDLADARILSGYLTRPFDVAVVCGDRHETLMAAFVLAMHRIPIAHLAGGDVSGGSLDERWRHAITKIADLHFPTNARAAARIQHMGEPRRTIHMLGSPAADRIVEWRNSGRLPTILAQSNFLPEEWRATGFILANWQPETTAADNGLHDLRMMLDALALVGSPVLIVGANADAGGAEANAAIRYWAINRWNRLFMPNLSPVQYLAALAEADCLVGNSSSGFYEAPYFGTPVVNLGGRQRGRLKPACVASAGYFSKAEDLAGLIREAAAEIFPREAPYGDGHAAEKIAKVILEWTPDLSLDKQFADKETIL